MASQGPLTQSACIMGWIFCRSKGRWRGSGGGGTCRGTWAPTPNISTRQSAAATTSAPRLPCWRGAAPKHAGLHPPATMTCPACESDGRRPRVSNFDLQRVKVRKKRHSIHLHKHCWRMTWSQLLCSTQGVALLKNHYSFIIQCTCTGGSLQSMLIVLLRRQAPCGVTC